MIRTLELDFYDGWFESEEFDIGLCLKGLREVFEIPDNVKKLWISFEDRFRGMDGWYYFERSLTKLIITPWSGRVADCEDDIVIYIGVSLEQVLRYFGNPRYGLMKLEIE